MAIGNVQEFEARVVALEKEIAEAEKSANPKLIDYHHRVAGLLSQANDETTHDQATLKERADAFDKKHWPGTRFVPGTDANQEWARGIAPAQAEVARDQTLVARLERQRHRVFGLMECQRYGYHKALPPDRRAEAVREIKSHFARQPKDADGMAPQLMLPILGEDPDPKVKVEVERLKSLIDGLRERGRHSAGGGGLPAPAVTGPNCEVRDPMKYQSDRLLFPGAEVGRSVACSVTTTAEEALYGKK